MFGGAKAIKRRSSLDRKEIRDNTNSKSLQEGKRAKQSSEYPAKKPPDIQNRLQSLMKLPQLPTSPIPVSELPPDSVRTPPKKLPTMIPALSSLTPIPLKDLNSPAKFPVTPVSASESISIQVPMAGADGTTIMQTINVPKSVLSGNSERILLTVTPKNGINKGQKQIVVLTKNSAGIGASVKPAVCLGQTPQSAPSKVQCSVR